MPPTDLEIRAYLEQISGKLAALEREVKELAGRVAREKHVPRRTRRARWLSLLRRGMSALLIGIVAWQGIYLLRTAAPAVEEVKIQQDLLSKIDKRLTRVEDRLAELTRHVIRVIPVQSGFGVFDGDLKDVDEVKSQVTVQDHRAIRVFMVGMHTKCYLDGRSVALGEYRLALGRPALVLFKAEEPAVATRIEVVTIGAVPQLHVMPSSHNQGAATPGRAAPSELGKGRQSCFQPVYPAEAAARS